MKYIAYFLFGITVVFLRVLALIFHTDYNTVNIWFYCIVGPLFFCVLIATLWAETAYGVVTHYHAMNVVSNFLLIGALLVLAAVICNIFVAALPVLHSIAGGNKDQMFQNCVDYLLTYNGGLSYVNINVLYFCLLGPAVFLLLLFLDITGLYHFHWHWLAIFNEPHAWRYWLNTIVLCCCVPCCYYALYVLKRYVMIK